MQTFIVVPDHALTKTEMRHPSALVNLLQHAELSALIGSLACLQFLINQVLENRM